MAELDLKNLDIEHFINAIKSRPAIWDTTAAEYHDLTKKRRAWIQIFRQFYAEFDRSPNKYEISTKLMNKWRDIKELFLKLARSGRTLYYPYAQQLSFLYDGTTISKKSAPGVNKKEENKKNQTPVRNSKRRRDRMKVIKETGRDSRKLDRDFESFLMRTLTPNHFSTVNTILDADRSFFESIMPSISAFTEDQKLEFRSEVLNVILKMRRKQNDTKNDSDNVSEGNTDQISEYESS